MARLQKAWGWLGHVVPYFCPWCHGIVSPSGWNRQLQDRLMGASPEKPGSHTDAAGLSHPAERGSGVEVTTGLDKDVPKKHPWWDGQKWDVWWLWGWQTWHPSQSYTIPEQGFYLPLAWLLSLQQGHAVLLEAKGINLTRLAPLLSLTWPNFVDLLYLCCLCSCCSFPIHVLASFWLQQPQLFILFSCHIQGRHREELGEGELWQSVQVCISVCVSVWTHLQGTSTGRLVPPWLPLLRKRRRKCQISSQQGSC